MALFCAPTINAYGRFRPNAMAPNALIWGRDNRGAMLRVLGRAGDAATRIENRIGEPSANPYLYIAAQIHAGLDGLSARPGRAAGHRGAVSPARADAAADASLGEALDALAADAAAGARVRRAGRRLVRRSSAPSSRATTSAEDKDAWQAREYFSRF